LFPQAAKVEAPNPTTTAGGKPSGKPRRACFDFWGYSSSPKDGYEKEGYCTKSGVQPRAVKAMIDRIIGQDKKMNY